MDLQRFEEEGYFEVVLENILMRFLILFKAVHLVWKEDVSLLNRGVLQVRKLESVKRKMKCEK